MHNIMWGSGKCYKEEREINPLLVALFANIFSHSESCLFVLCMVSFAVQKLLSFIRSHLFIFVFIFITLGGKSKKILLQFMPYDPAIPLLDIYLEKTVIRKDICTPMFTAALFTIARTWKQPKYPSAEEWIRRCGTCIQWNDTQP